MVNLSDYVLVVFQGEDWDESPVGFTRNKMLSGLAKYCGDIGVTILGVERPICPIVTAVKKPAKLSQWLSGQRGLRQIRPNMYLCTPWFFLHERLAPFVPGVVTANCMVLKKQILSCLSDLGLREKKQIVLLFHPYQKDMLRVFEPELTIYECYDEYAPASQRTSPVNPSPREARRIRQYEKGLLDFVDVVITTSEVLYEKCKARNSQTFLLHNGVNYELFSQENLQVHEEVRDIAHPIIGFAGRSKSIVEFELVSSCARLHPEWNFVFLGPEDPRDSFQSLPAFREAKRQPNISFWGVKPELEVPRYMKAFDVCIIPYATDSDFATAVYPLKLNEYLALGKPVVSTNYVTDFREYKDVIWLVEDQPESFCAAIKEALNGPHSYRIRRGKEIARANSWVNRGEKLYSIISSVLEGRL